jgi:hypothetical protein
MFISKILLLRVNKYISKNGRWTMVDIRNSSLAIDLSEEGMKIQK